MAEDAGIKITENVPDQAAVNKLKWALFLTPTAAVTAYIIAGAATGDWNPLDWYDFSDVTNEPNETPENIGTSEQNLSTEDATDVTNAPEQNVPTDETIDDVLAKTTAAAAAPCAAGEVAEEVKEKVCVGPEKELVATANSSCDGIISLTREALWGNADFVTPEMVANIENPFVKAVYQALLDGDRSALTTALTNLYAENGAFDPENASGVLDGLKDSIIIYEGDRIVIDENGWTLVRKGGDEVALVDCEGKLLNVDEKMSDTGKCGDETPQVTRGNAAPVIPVEPVPVQEIKEPEICTDIYVDQPYGDPYRNGSLDRLVIYEDNNGTGKLESGEDTMVADVRGQKAVARYIDANPDIAKPIQENGVNLIEINGEKFVKIRGEYYRWSFVEPIVKSGGRIPMN